MSIAAIKVDHLSKRYRIGHREELQDTLSGAIASWLQSPVVNLRRVRNLSRFAETGDGKDVIWALKDISFEIRAGEVVGVIGKNGAGKSTLLKILSRITEPTSGRAEICGRLSSLLEVGTGFHPDLTGRENIYLNSAILGMKKSEIHRKFNEIVDFAEVSRFIDTPVKRYSTGMRVRLAFAVAAHLDPRILLVDEVLAVGDEAFQRKCLGKISEVGRQGRTVLFVSHNLAAISSFCERALLIDKGELRLEGKPSFVVGHYLAEAAGAGLVPLMNRNDRRGNGRLKFVTVELRDKRVPKSTGRLIGTGHDIDIVLRYELNGIQELRNVAVALIFVDAYDRRLFTCFTDYKNANFQIKAGTGEITCHVNRFPLLRGRYGITIWCSAEGELADRIDSALTFDVVGDDFFGSGKLPPAEKNGPFLVDHSWRISQPLC